MPVKYCITLLTLFVLAGCASSESTPKSFYYTLDAMSSKQDFVSKQTGNSRQVKVRPVILPDYLNQPNLILKISEHQIKIANYHFWAENLGKTIQQVMINDLNSKSIEYSFSKECINCDELVITIEQFYPSQSGEVVLTGSYFRSSDYKHNRFSLTKQLTNGGYDEAVSAMRKLLSELAEQVATQVILPSAQSSQ